MTETDIKYKKVDKWVYGEVKEIKLIGEDNQLKKGMYYLPVSGGAKRIKSNVIFALNSYWCDSNDINNSGKCR